jgi:hypothetical protein
MPTSESVSRLWDPRFVRFRITEELEIALSVDPANPKERIEITMDDHSVLRALGRHLDLCVSYDDMLYDVLVTILRALEDLLRTGPPKNPQEWAREAVASAVADLDREQLHEVLTGLGMKNSRIPGQPKLRDLSKTFRKMLIHEVEPRVTGLVVSWKTNHTFEDAAERRRAHAAAAPRLAAQRRRDLASTPSFTPPPRY